MAIKINESTKEVAGGGVKLYSGLANFKVIAVNPTSTIAFWATSTSVLGVVGIYFLLPIVFLFLSSLD